MESAANETTRKKLLDEKEFLRIALKSTKDELDD